MNYRQFGTVKVSEIGFGAWQLGNSKDWSPMSDDSGIRLVHEALDLGVNFFDTAPNYGLGKSEELLGKALKTKRDQVVISTKFGHSRTGLTNYDPNVLRTSLQDSLKALHMDYVDSLLLHNPPFEALSGAWGHFEILERLKDEGLIRYYGASVDSSREMMELINKTNCQVIEVMFNVFHQDTRLAFEAAKAKGISLIIKVPLDSGWLSGKYNKQSQFHDIRSRWSKETLERRFALLEDLKTIIHHEGELSQMALQFILAHDEVTTVIPGSKNSTQLHSNVSAANTKLSNELKNKIINLYQDKIKNNPLPW